MVSPSLQHPLIFLLHTSFFLLHNPSTALTRHRPPSIPLIHPSTTANSDDTPPTTYLEVTKPINHPKTNPCSYLLLHHDFAYTYGKAPVSANYTPPTDCPAKKFSTIVLSWSATCKGRQLDRIFGVWLGGVELLRSCTAEPRLNGISWKVDKDITRYYSLLMSNQTLVVNLGNVVTTVYTGIYNVDISIHFYPSEENVIGTGNWADLILPISRNPPLNDGLWFEIQNSTHVEVKEFEIPLNCYRAVLEVYVSFHENDEFWYTNLPDDFIAANNFTVVSGNGPFREIVVTLDNDDVLVGVIWPFTVIYTGGFNPLLWRPISGVGSFDFPTYDIELTPFLGMLLDGRRHKIGFSVTNALNVWYIDANLHLWLDNKRSRTMGKVLNYHAPPPKISSESDFRGLNGTFATKAKRSISSTGWVRSSHGKITTSFTQHLNFANFIVMGDDGSSQTVNQTIEFHTSIMSSSSYYRQSYNKTFDLYLYYDEHDQDENDYFAVNKATLGLKEDKIDGDGSSTSSLRNSQTAEGNLVVQKGVLDSGWGRTHQVYRYDSSTQPCYLRNVSSFNYTILHDQVMNVCST